MNFSEAIKALKENSKPRRFDQTLDLIVNLKDFDPKRESFSFTIELPFEGKSRKICGIFERKFKDMECLTRAELEALTKDEAKKLVKKYDCFIASAPLMPLIAAKLGKLLGPRGKMPDPSIGGVLAREEEQLITSTCAKLKRTFKLKVTQASIKIPIGKESMPNEQLSANAEAAFNAIVAMLPKGQLNIKSVLLKLTMSPPLRVR